MGLEPVKHWSGYEVLDMWVIVTNWNVLNACMSAMQDQNFLWSKTYKIKGIHSIGFFYNFLLPPSNFLTGAAFRYSIFNLFG